MRLRVYSRVEYLFSIYNSTFSTKEKGNRMEEEGAGEKNPSISYFIINKKIKMGHGGTQL